MVRGVKSKHAKKALRKATKEIVGPQLRDLVQTLDKWNHELGVGRHPRTVERNLGKHPEFVFEEGTYVLVSKATREKLQPQWYGPMQVVGKTEGPSGNTYVVQDLINKQTKKVHAMRMRFYDESDMIVGPHLEAAMEWNEGGHIIKQILDHEISDSGVNLHIEWEAGDRTWEEGRKFQQDSKFMVAHYLRRKSVQESDDYDQLVHFFNSKPDEVVSKRKWKRATKESSQKGRSARKGPKRKAVQQGVRPAGGRKRKPGPKRTRG